MNKRVLPQIPREHELSIISDWLIDHTQSDCKTVAFHGMGGVGKTELCQQFHHYLSTNISAQENFALGHVDLENLVVWRADQFLVLLRNSLQDSKIDFSVFDFATLMHWTANRSAENVPPLKHSFLSQSLGVATDDVAANLINDEFEDLTRETMIDILDELPMARFLFKIGRRWLVNTARVKLLKNIKDRIRIFYEEDGKTPIRGADISDLLLPCFIEDLNRYTRENTDSKVAILIDQYESMFEAEGSRSYLVSNPIAEIIKTASDDVKNCFLCLFAREKGLFSDDLFWREKNNFELLELDGFSENQARKALSGSGVGAKNAVEQFLAYSRNSNHENRNFHPIRLNEIVAVYQASPELFDGEFDLDETDIAKNIDIGIAKRVLNNQNPELRQLLKFTYLLNGFREDFWAFPKTRSELTIRLETLEALKSQSFVIMRDNKIVVDAPITRGLRYLIPAEERHALIGFLRTALDHFLQEHATQSNSHIYRETFLRANELNVLSEPCAYIDWLDEASKPLFESGDLQLLTLVWNNALKLLDGVSDTSAIHKAKCLSQIGTCHRRQDQEQEALNFFKAAAQLVISETSFDMVAAQVCNNYADSLKRLDQFDDAVEVWNKAKEFEPDFMSPEEVTTKVKILHNLADALVAKQEFDLAEEAIFETFNTLVLKPGSFHKDLASTYNTIAFIAFNKEDFQQAEENFRLALRCKGENRNSHFIGSAIMYQNYALVLETNGKTKQALTYYKKARDVLQNQYSIPHFELSYALLKISELELQLEDQNAAVSAQAAVDVFSQCLQSVYDPDGLYESELKKFHANLDKVLNSG